MITTTTPTKKIWGLEVEEIFDGDFLIWKTRIKNPFKEEEWKIGLNEKFLRMAMVAGVNKFIIQIGQREIMMWVPDLKELKRKNKAGEFEMRPSMFEGSPAMKIYYFRV